ncbi:hypothetical protein PISL3812_01931 [Talaromyces islandicus]|uniref:Uncharacterized protein n=1 Tax=Talaromyces islandicus TaxID=28573 RepID=A0A0U1LQP9_TALIS|nr:hypothetical protein PISL3812_01931 [Talaromyces islandicus]
MGHLLFLPFSPNTEIILLTTLPITQLVLQGSAEFDELNSSYLSVLDNDITPECIFRPKTMEGVSTFLQTTGSFAGSEGVRLEIRGGGQQPLPVCANIENNITLDLRLLTGVEVKDDIVSIAAGERWENAYDAGRYRP